MPRPKPFFAFAVLLVGCAGPKVSMREGFDFQKIHGIAVLDFRDFPGKAGSGNLVASAFEEAFLDAHYDIIERQEVDKVLKEQSFSSSGAVDPKKAKELGNILGVDALVVGSLTDFTASKTRTVMTDIHEDVSTPIFVKKTKKVKQGDQWVDVEEDVIEGYKTNRTVRKVPQTLTEEALVGVSIRMVSVDNGQVLWVGAASETGASVEDAAEEAAHGILKAVKKTWPKPEKK